MNRRSQTVSLFVMPGLVPGIYVDRPGVWGNPPKETPLAKPGDDGED